MSRAAPANNARRGAGHVVVVSGPSGVGKSTILRQVLDRCGAEFSVSATTRPPRPGEVDGRDYHFLDRKAFERMIESDELLEWAEVFGHFYGTPAAPVRNALESSRTIILDIDVQGAVQVHRKLPEATFVLIAPPDEQTLAARLSGRGTEHGLQLQRRLAKAAAELSTARDSGIYDYTIINDDLERAVAALCRIVQAGAKGK